MSDIIYKIKDEIGFGLPASCGRCHHVQKDDFYSDRPSVYKCTFAGSFKFEVDENDICQEWKKQDF